MLHVIVSWRLLFTKNCVCLIDALHFSCNKRYVQQNDGSWIKQSMVTSRCKWFTSNLKWVKFDTPNHYRLQKGCPWLVSWGYQSIKFGHRRREPKRTGQDCDLSLRCRSSTPLGTSCSLSAWRKGWRVGPVERCEKGWSRGDCERGKKYQISIFMHENGIFGWEWRWTNSWDSAASGMIRKWFLGLAMTCQLKTSVNDHEIIYWEEDHPFPKVVRI